VEDDAPVGANPICDGGIQSLREGRAVCSAGAAVDVLDVADEDLGGTSHIELIGMIGDEGRPSELPAPRPDASTSATDVSASSAGGAWSVSLVTHAHSPGRTLRGRSCVP
jgi:hypothetical protein